MLRLPGPNTSQKLAERVQKLLVVLHAGRHKAAVLG